jgi:hypothetical protein
MNSPIRSKLFYKARARIIEEIALQMVSQLIDEDGLTGQPLPTSWVNEAEARKEQVITEILEETARENEEVNSWHPKAKN